MPAVARVSQPAQLALRFPEPVQERRMLPAGVRHRCFCGRERVERKEKWRKGREGQEHVHPACARENLTSRLALACSRRALTIHQKYSQLFKNT
uniref:Uncharacterized protein n=1 Tax=Rhipicephalus zambeziensis TaxID=60191 RepID=A0A224Y7T8_9ACAR